MNDEDARTPPTPAHAIGQPLDLLSVAELEERMALLHAEILRLEAAKEKKQAASAAAEAVFRR